MPPVTIANDKFPAMNPADARKKFVVADPSFAPSSIVAVTCWPAAATANLTLSQIISDFDV
jgi:hypothetical protein